jgi:hypothetical protein
MACSSVTQERCKRPAYRPDVRSGFPPFPALKQNLGGHKFEDDRSMETGVTRSLVTRDPEFCRHGLENSSHDVKCHNFGETAWKISGLAVRVAMHFFLADFKKDETKLHCKVTEIKKLQIHRM